MALTDRTNLDVVALNVPTPAFIAPRKRPPSPHIHHPPPYAKRRRFQNINEVAPRVPDGRITSYHQSIGYLEAQTVQFTLERWEAESELTQKPQDYHIHQFFDLYPEFPYDVSKSHVEEFNRMVDFFHWYSCPKEKMMYRSLFDDAMTRDGYEVEKKPSEVFVANVIDVEQVTENEGPATDVDLAEVEEIREVVETAEVEVCTTTGVEELAVIEDLPKPRKHRKAKQVRQRLAGPQTPSKKSRNKSDGHYLSEFFSYYSEFLCNPKKSATNEFQRMCRFFGWSPINPKYKEARRYFNDAMVHEFNSIYGMRVDDITSWRKLCKDLNITPIPKLLEGCQEAILATHVNIVDLVEARASGGPVRIPVFDSEEDLSDYTIERSRYFPRENAYAGGLLRLLLRRILKPGVKVKKTRRVTIARTRRKTRQFLS